MSAIKGELGEQAGSGKILQHETGETGQPACATPAGKQLPAGVGDLVKRVSETAGSTTGSLSQATLDHKTDQFHPQKMKFCHCEAL